MAAVLLQANPDDPQSALIESIERIGGPCFFELQKRGIRLCPILFLSRACTGRESSVHSYLGEASVACKLKNYLLGRELIYSNLHLLVNIAQSLCLLNITKQWHNAGNAMYSQMTAPNRDPLTSIMYTKVEFDLFPKIMITSNPKPITWVHISPIFAKLSTPHHILIIAPVMCPVLEALEVATVQQQGQVIWIDESIPVDEQSTFASHILPAENFWHLQKNWSLFSIPPGNRTFIWIFPGSKNVDFSGSSLSGISSESRLRCWEAWRPSNFLTRLGHYLFRCMNFCSLHKNLYTFNTDDFFCLSQHFGFLHNLLY
jgi:hypothetical protein